MQNSIDQLYLSDYYYASTHSLVRKFQYVNKRNAYKLII